ncbi:MAG TPA: 1-(5-phosphoribosyl)-5-[(5-phosphoribosylamino)methylideneamino] imidazole-4-carboxamide isomerase [Steroidobacteraceae bacterium]
MLLIPSIDLRGGQCVRLLRGDFAAETRYPESAQQLLARYRDLGVRWLHVVDLDGARDGAGLNRQLILELAAQRSVQLQVGGGLRDRAAVDELLAGGVARAIIGSAAAERPQQVMRWLAELGAERIGVAFDVRLDAHGVPRLYTRGWRETTSASLWDAVADFAKAGVRHVLCTDIDRDGALAGPNIPLYDEALRRFPRILWQASGGIASGADLAALAQRGVPAAVSGKALLEQRIKVQELRPFLPNA